MVLWSYHTILHSSTQETPFKMVYGSNAMIPIEHSVRVHFAQMGKNANNLLSSLNLQKEVRGRDHLMEETSKMRAAWSWRYD
jgi:hypothetical protein